MIIRSIPGLEQLRNLINNFALSHGGLSLVYDLGCSTGISIDSLSEVLPVGTQYKGFDASLPMLEVARAKFADSPNVEIEYLNLEESFNLEPADLVLLIFTLQFVNLKYRQQIVKSIFDCTKPGGTLIFAEKIKGSSNYGDTLLTDLYHKYKYSQGYSIAQIENKQKALEGVLVPLTLDENINLLVNAGFRSVDIFWCHYNFVGIVATKGE